MVGLDHREAGLGRLHQKEEHSNEGHWQRDHSDDERPRRAEGAGELQAIGSDLDRLIGVVSR